MSWINENKFVAGLAGVTVVLAGGIYYFGSSQADQYDEKIIEYEDLKAKNLSLQKSSPFPDQGNLKARQDNIAKYEDLINDVKKTFTGFSAGQLTNLNAEQFNDRRVEMEKELRAAFGETTLPEKTAFGFEKYTTDAVKSNATGLLAYQMGAIQWVLTELAKTKPEEVNNIMRAELDVERGVAATPQPPQRGRNNRQRRGAKPVQAKKAYELMPVELSFTASESSLRTFLESMVNSKQYFFSVRALRVRNEKQIPPNVKDAGFPADRGGGGGAPAAGDDDPFAGIELPAEGGDGEDANAGEGDDGGAAPAPAPAPKPAAAKGERILKQVLGDEKLHVFIRFDIVYIKGTKQEEKPAATQGGNPQ